MSELLATSFIVALLLRGLLFMWIFAVFILDIFAILPHCLVALTTISFQKKKFVFGRSYLCCHFSISIECGIFGKRVYFPFQRCSFFVIRWMSGTAESWVRFQG